MLFAFWLRSDVETAKKKKRFFFLDFNAITLNLEIRENVHLIYWLCSAKARKSYFIFIFFFWTQALLSL